MPAFRKPTRRETVFLCLLAVVVLTAGWWLVRAPEAARTTQARRAAEAAVQPVPRIDLARLEQPASSEEAGRRNLFAFGAAPVAVQPAPPPIVLPSPPPVTAKAGPAGDGFAAPTLPPLNVRYIGSVENAAGARVAVLLTDRQEVLTGEAGQVVANRYRVARIGLESVDLEDVNTGQSRRIALRGS